MKSYFDIEAQEIVYYRESVSDNLKIRYDVARKYFDIYNGGDFLDSRGNWADAYSYFEGLEE